MSETPSSERVLTKCRRIAWLAMQNPQMAFTSLNHYLDVDWLHEAFQRVRKDGAPGVDGQTWHDYEAQLEDNLQSLLNRAKSGTYRAPPVRRVHIPKGGSSTETRPIGIPTLAAYCTWFNEAWGSWGKNFAARQSAKIRGPMSRVPRLSVDRS